jgi:hypothetical protein
MKNNRLLTELFVPALLMSGCLSVISVARAAENTTSTDVTKLLADTRDEAVLLQLDSEDLDAFTRTQLSWQSHAAKVNMIKDHVNAAGKLLAKLKDTEPTAAVWQQTAIERIEPMLKDLAANTEATIRYLNENQNKVHLQEFRAYAAANYDLAKSLAALIGDYVDYGQAKDKMESLEVSLELSE